MGLVKKAKPSSNVQAQQRGNGFLQHATRPRARIQTDELHPPSSLPLAAEPLNHAFLQTALPGYLCNRYLNALHNCSLYGVDSENRAWN